MTRRDNSELRCTGCRLHRTLCACAFIPRLETRTRVSLFIHHFEDRKSTNTGRLATRCLVNSGIVVRGRESAPTEAFVPDPNTQALLLFPHPHALPLQEFVGSERPITLVVPDGTWRQASKVQKRVPGLGDVPCVMLSGGPRSSYRMRSEPHADGLSTIEAIARALGLLEGAHVQEALERVFRIVVERALWARGTLETADVTDGIPEGAQRHDPGGSAGPGR